MPWRPIPAPRRARTGVAATLAVLLGAAAVPVPAASAAPPVSAASVGFARAPVPSASATDGAARAAPAGPSHGVDDLAAWAPDVAAARAYALRRPGVVGFVVRESGLERSFRGARSVPAASLMKTMFLAAYLRSGEVRRRALTRRDRALLSPMISRSDDVAATRVRSLVGDGRLRRLAHAAGMVDFVPHRVWGLSRTSARDQVRLFLALDDLLPARHRAYARRLLETVVPSQRWGIGAVPLPAGWTLRFKGGWGSGSGAVDHQSALLVGGGRRIAVGITTTGNGSHATGKATLRGVAARLLHGLAPVPAEPETAPSAAAPAP